MIKKIKKLYYILRVIPLLGWYNVVYAAYYKLSLRFSLLKKKFPIGKPILGIFFHSCTRDQLYPEFYKTGLIHQADNILEGKFTWFSYHTFEVGKMPNWFSNPFDGTDLNDPTLHWTDYGDFNLNTGDIKIIWELSRFDWLTILARAYKVTGEDKYLNRLNEMLKDWSSKNPANIGPNWKCGQEASIRVMRLMTTGHILNQLNSPTTALVELMAAHVERIYANITYSIIQDNNHGTSEATGLYIGAAWLLKHEPNNRTWLTYKNKGRKILENRITKLIQPDGSFAQRSMTYHRVVVDTMSFVLHMLDLLQEPSFNDVVLDRIQKLAEWQYKLTMGVNGDAPNYGSNDGALFENLHNQDYRDFRPSTQLLFGCLKKQIAYEDQSISEPIYWRYGSQVFNWKRIEIIKPRFEILDHQMLIMRNGPLELLLKIPEASFRPGNDAFHIDLWQNGNNVLCDSGSYSYNAGSTTDAFKSVAAHNTVQFEAHEQMPKISKFLYGEWITPNFVDTIKDEGGVLSWKGMYTDFKGNVHKRNISLSVDELIVEDEIHTTEAIKIRFKGPGLKHTEISYEEKLAYWVQSDTSLYYLQKSPIDQLVLSVDQKDTQKIATLSINTILAF